MVVAGGGPAGLLVASRLAARHKVILVEAGSLGRTTRFWITTVRRLEKHGLAHCTRYKSDSMLIGTYLGGHADIYGDLVVVDEDLLLQELLLRCRNAGVQLIDHCQLLSLSWSGGQILVRCTSHTFRSRLLLDCTGDNSPIVRTFRPHRIEGFYSIIGAHLSPIKLRSSQIILSYVTSLGDPAFNLEVAPTGEQSAYCALYTYAKQLVSVQQLDTAFRQHCQQNPFFETSSATRTERGKSGAIIIGRSGRRSLPNVVFLGGAALVQPPLLGSGFNEILEHSNRICDQLSSALAFHGRQNIVSTFEFYPLIKRAQDRLQLLLVRRLLRKNVEELDRLIRFVARLPQEQAFKLCSSELSWMQLLRLVPPLLGTVATRQLTPRLTSRQL